MESQKQQNKLLSALLKIQHGDLAKSYDEVYPTAEKEPALFAHALAWNHKHGRVRDSKIAFPVIALRTEAMKDDEFAENAVAHLAMLGPRDLVKAYRFSKELSKAGKTARHRSRRLFELMLRQYLQQFERSRGRWNAAVVRHRAAMVELYSVSHRKAEPYVKSILYEKNYPDGSVFAVVRDLGRMESTEAAAAILKYRIPYTVVRGSGLVVDHRDVLLALIQTMSANELVTAANALSKLDAWKLPLIQDAFGEATGKASKDKRANVLKATKAASAAPAAAKQLSRVKEGAADSLRKIEGDWLVLADKSGSMTASVEIGKQLAALLAHRVAGSVGLTFFDTTPLKFSVTGKSLEEIEHMTKGIVAEGGTSIGCGLRALRESRGVVDGIVVVSDGGENAAPWFTDEYSKLGFEPSIYFLMLVGENNVFSHRLERAGIPFTAFDVRSDFDYNAMMNVVNVLKPMTYGFLEEVLATPLVSLNDVFKKGKNDDGPEA